METSSKLNPGVRKRFCGLGFCSQVWWLPRVWAVFLLVLIAATWRLWIGDSAYPSVPMVSMPEAVQRWLSMVMLAVIACGCIAVVLAPGRLMWAWLLISASLAVSFVVDQHRLQPWAYQAAIYGVIFATMRESTARRWLIWLSASVYVYSSLGKFDYQFAHTVGQDFLKPLYSLSGLDQKLSPSQSMTLALTLPAIELMSGIGVLIPRTCRIAGYLIVTMHAGLFLLLSPLGFHHSYGVLLWNVLLGVSAWELFIRESTHISVTDSERAVSVPGPISGYLARGFALFVLMAPITERFGYWDHWPSWALYSPHNSRIKLQVHSSALESLPAALRSDAEQTRGWIDVDLDAWSLASRDVPIYPQSRYQLAMATKLANKYQLGNGVRCVEQSVSDRWTGRRDERVAIGVDEMRQLLKAYWLVPASI